MNAPSRYEMFVLADGEPKVTVEEDTKIPNAATLTINKEDHTLANMLRSQLLLLSYVQFAGYKVPHPLESRVVLKLQTDGSQTPIQAVHDAIGQLMLLLGKAKAAFSQELIKSRALDGAEDAFGGAGEGFY
ncbi:DNA-directed RNA polymerase II core subunit RPB11 [Sporobolomyces salmoneus]|uniref:DNA-directed RNA polymerase II core subunit RPB11 n=1 Tax=Sporobolomyces salmoneus TaxID=183962 RepID=UPI0031798957